MAPPGMKQAGDYAVLPEAAFLPKYLEELGRADVVPHPLPGRKTPHGHTPSAHR